MNFNQNKFAYAYMSLIAEQNKGINDLNTNLEDKELAKTGDVIDGKSDAKYTEEDIVDGDSEIKTVKFVTSDKNLLDALSNDFEKVTIFVKGKQDEDKLEEIEILKDSFGPIEILDVEEEQPEDDQFIDQSQFFNEDDDDAVSDAGDDVADGDVADTGDVDDTGDEDI